MPNKSIKIFCTNTGTYEEVEGGTTLLEIQKKYGIESKYPIVNAKVNNKTESLNYAVYQNKTITFVGINESSGMRTYVRSLCFLLAKAVSEVIPNGSVKIEHPISLGYFCYVSGDVDRIGNSDLVTVKNKMKEYIADNLLFEEIEDETPKVVKLFKEQGYSDKALLLETTGSMYSKYYKLGDSVDYYYGSLVPSTGYLNLFDIIPCYGGWLLQIPNRKDPHILESFIEQPKMFDVFNRYRKFLNVIQIENVGDMNKAHFEKRMSTVIKTAEAYQEKVIAETAEQIAKKFCDGVRLVLISGPSSSGKTTFRMRLEVQLMVNLLTPVGLSLDNYFVEKDKTPRDENGDYDFESFYALDLELFNSDLNALLRGKEVSLPTFNFVTGKREYKGNKLKMNDNNILVIEGIHGLNPALTPNIEDYRKYKIYVSALTSLTLDDHNWIPTTDNRLLRRLVRDYHFRNYSAIETLSRWEGVRRGEEKWIFPYQENADMMFNSAMLYELAALRHHAEPILREVPKNVPEFAEAKRLLNFLSYFNYISDQELPPTSLLREFLGGSSFSY